MMGVMPDGERCGTKKKRAFSSETFMGTWEEVQQLLESDNSPVAKMPSSDERQSPAAGASARGGGDEGTHVASWMDSPPEKRSKLGAPSPSRYDLSEAEDGGTPRSGMGVCPCYDLREPAESPGKEHSWVDLDSSDEGETHQLCTTAPARSVMRKIVSVEHLARVLC